MAHLLEKMAYYGETPWHGLGHRTNQAMTMEEAITLGGLDFPVEKRAIALADCGTVCPENYAIVRTDRTKNHILGIVGSDYTPLQNVEMFNFFDPFVSRKEAMIHTVGSLKHGRKIWVLAQLPGEIVVKGQDVTNKYLLIANSHDGSGAVRIKFTPIRVVCNNTLTAALRSDMANTFSIRHTKNVAQAVADASRVMGIANSYYEEFQQAAARMADTSLKSEDVKSFLDRCFAKEIKAIEEKDSTRSKNIMAQVYELAETGQGTEIPGVRGTVWGAFNAVTEFVDHGRNYRNGESRLENVWFSGQGQATKQRAMELALELIK